MKTVIARWVGTLCILGLVLGLTLSTGSISTGRGQEADAKQSGKQCLDARGNSLVARAEAAEGGGSDSAKAAPSFDPSGKKLSEADAKAAAAAATTAAAKACLELYNGPAVDFKINITYNPNSYPFVITGGTISGTICGSPNWVVTGGSMGPTLTVTGKRTGGGSCADTITVVGHYQNPPSYAGTYGFDGASTSFPHTTTFCCGACPP
jgi:hypothetical protein